MVRRSAARRDVAQRSALTEGQVAVKRAQVLVALQNLTGVDLTHAVRQTTKPVQESACVGGTAVVRGQREVQAPKLAVQLREVARSEADIEHRVKRMPLRTL